MDERKVIQPSYSDYLKMYDNDNPSLSESQAPGSQQNIQDLLDGDLDDISFSE